MRAPSSVKLIDTCNLYEVIENHKREILKKNCLIKRMCKVVRLRIFLQNVSPLKKGQ